MLTFQDIILTLQQYWADQGCVILQPYDSEVGAGTYHTATAQPTDATVRIPIACSTTTSSR